MDPIYESYKQAVNKEFDGALLTSIAEGLLTSEIDKRKKNQPKFTDWLASFIKWGMSNGDEAIDIRDIRKYAYEGYEEWEAKNAPANTDLAIVENIIEENSNILNKLKSLKNKGGKKFSKTIGTIIGRMIKYAQLPAKTIDKVLNATKT